MDERVDVLLVNPTRAGIDSYCTPPLHLLYLARAIEDAGFTTRLVNVHEDFCKAAGVLKNDEAHLDAKRQAERRAIDDILQADARVVGIGSICSSYEFVEQLAIALKQAKPDTPIILGGSLGLPLKELWFKHTRVDYLCEADGERLIVDFLRNLDNPQALRAIPGLHWRGESGFEGNKPDLPTDLDYINPPDIRRIDYAFYMKILKEWVNHTLPRELKLSDDDRLWPVLFTRGCVYNCAFCFHFNRRHRRHSIPYVINHLRTLRDEFGVTVVVTWDDLVMGNPKWFMELCAELEKQNLGIRIFTSGGKANMITPEMAAAMARAGFIRISFGIESGSQTVLDEMQKQATVEDNRNAVRYASQAGIFVHLNMVLGMPSETRRTLDETYDFLIGVVRENNLSIRNLSFSFATGYPGTQLFDHMLRKGLVTDVRQYILDVKGVGYPTDMLCELSHEDLRGFLDRLNFKVNDICLARQGRHFRRFVNRAIRSAPVRLVARHMPASVKDRIGEMLR